MCRRHESSHGPAFLAKAHLAGLYIDTDSAASNELVKLAAIGQLDELIDRDRVCVPAAAAHDV
jgi:hypothetical protein